MKWNMQVPLSFTVALLIAYHLFTLHSHACLHCYSLIDNRNTGRSVFALEIWLKNVEKTSCLSKIWLLNAVCPFQGKLIL